MARCESEHMAVNDIELAVLTALQGRYGKGRAMQRSELIYHANLFLDRPEGEEIGDRSVREAIESLRQNHPRGALIMSSAGWSGYWLAETIEEFELKYQEDRNRALAIMVRLRKQRDLLKGQFGNGAVDPEPQIRMFA